MNEKIIKKMVICVLIVNTMILHKEVYIEAKMLIEQESIVGTEEIESTPDSEEEETIEAEEKTDTIRASELDLGEYQTLMAVGDKQLLTVTVLPLNATEQSVIYRSENKKVAEINGMGRITAKEVGTSRITVTCGNIKEEFELHVVETLEEETEKIEVTDLEIADYEEELEVGKTVMLNTTVLPSNVTDSTVFYQSSDPSIAMVNSLGEIKGIAPGKVIIYCSAGSIVREAYINVKVSTASIKVNKDYVVLKLGQCFNVKTEIKPEKANQIVTYHSLNEKIASVSLDGCISAKHCGSTNIIVSNGDISASISVIVNDNGSDQNVKESIQNNKINEMKHYPDKLDTSDVYVLTRDMLKYYYKNKKIMYLYGDGYTIVINENKICNYENILYTQISFKETKEGIMFELNHGKDLCGEIELDLQKNTGNYLYLYNASKGKYQLLDMDDVSALHLTKGGKYLLTKEKISDIKVEKATVIGGSIILIVLSGVYVFLKKRYWFW